VISIVKMANGAPHFKILNLIEYRILSNENPNTLGNENSQNLN
jgi:hypothetical protein